MAASLVDETGVGQVGCQPLTNFRGQSADRLLPSNRLSNCKPRQATVCQAEALRIARYVAWAVLPDAGRVSHHDAGGAALFCRSIGQGERRRFTGNVVGRASLDRRADLLRDQRLLHHGHAACPAKKGGVIEFAKRRFWRIYPPYWTAIALSAVVILALNSRWPGLFHDGIFTVPNPDGMTRWEWLGNLTLTESWRHCVFGGHAATLAAEHLDVVLRGAVLRHRGVDFVVCLAPDFHRGGGRDGCSCSSARRSPGSWAGT